MSWDAEYPAVITNIDRAKRLTKKSGHHFHIRTVHQRSHVGSRGLGADQRSHKTNLFKSFLVVSGLFRSDATSLSSRFHEFVLFKSGTKSNGWQ